MSVFTPSSSLRHSIFWAPAVSETKTLNWRETKRCTSSKIPSSLLSGEEQHTPQMAGLGWGSYFKLFPQVCKRFTALSLYSPPKTEITQVCMPLSLYSFLPSLSLWAKFIPPIVQLLKTILFSVRVPVLSENIYLICPRSSLILSARHRTGWSISA